MEMKLQERVENTLEIQKHDSISRYDYYNSQVLQKYFTCDCFVLSTIVLASTDADNQELSLWYLNTHNYNGQLWYKKRMADYLQQQNVNQCL